MKKETFTLSPNEWLVMEQLWMHPATQTEMIHALEQDPPCWAGSTTKTMLRRLEKKGLIRYETVNNVRVYSATISRDEAATAETRTLLNKAFKGSFGLLVNTLAEQESLSEEDMETLYRLLEKTERKDGDR